MKSLIDDLKKENNQLKYQKRQKNEEFKVLEWYTAVLEDGKNTKELWHELEQKRIDVEKLTGKLRVIKDEHKLKVAAIREKLKKTKLFLTKQNKEVV